MWHRCCRALWAMAWLVSAKSGCSRTQGFDDVREVFTLHDVDGDFSALGAMFFILLAFVL